MTRKILPLAALALLLTVFVGPVSAGELTEYPDPECSVVIDNPAATFGDSIVATGTGDPGDEATATYTVGGEVLVLGSTTADAQGDWTLPVDIPAGGDTAGALEVSSTNCGVLLALVLDAHAVATPTAEPLAFTGSNSGPMTTVAGLLLLAGGGLVLISRRRNSQA